VVAAPTAPTAKKAVTAVGDSGPDLSTWVFWWEFNKEPYLNLKAKIHSGGMETGASDVLVGLEGGTPRGNVFKPSPNQVFGTIVPALKKQLQTETNRDIITGDLIALAKIGNNGDDKPLVDLFLPFLHHSVQEIAETAALALGILQSEEALPVLKSLLLDEPQGRKLVGKESGVPLRTRTFAAFGLGLIGHASSSESVKKDIADTLWTVLTTDQSPLKDIRVASVISMGILDSEDPSETAQNLSDFLADDSHDFLVRAHCPNAIAKLLKDKVSDGDRLTPFIDQFIGLLNKKGEKAEVRQSCVQALGMMVRPDMPQAEKVVRQLVQTGQKGRDQQEKNFTAVSLGKIAAIDPNAKISAEVIQFLLKQLQKGSTNYRTWCAIGLGVMTFDANENEKSVPPIVPRAVAEMFKKAKAPSQRSAYAIALGLMKYEAAKPVLRNVMETSGDPSLRGYIAVALGLMSAREYKDDITRVVEKSSRRPELLRQSSIGLGLMSDRDVVPTLLKFLSPPDGGRPVLSVLSASATALGFIGDQRSVTPLVNMMNNKDLTPLARAFAGIALGIVGDKEPLPWVTKISEDLNYRASVDTIVDQSGGSGILDIL